MLEIDGKQMIQQDLVEYLEDWLLDANIEVYIGTFKA